MMYHAAIAGKGVDAVVYIGTDVGEKYPAWFEDGLLDGALILDTDGTVGIFEFDENDAPMIGPQLTPWETVVIRNRNNDIRAMTMEQFEKLYYTVGPHRAALKEDCVEYYMFWPGSFVSDVPGWIYDLWLSGKILDQPAEWDTQTVYDGAGVPYETSCLYAVVINRHANVRCLRAQGTTPSFETEYESTLPYRVDWAMDPKHINNEYWLTQGRQFDKYKPMEG